MLSNYINKFKTKIDTFLKRDYVGQLDSYEKKLSKLFNYGQQKKLRIMIGPSFAIWGASYVLDKSLSFALRIRGAEVIPIYCDSVQSTECNYIGGHWGDFQKDCKNCKKTSEKIWRMNGGGLKFSSYITQEDYQVVSCEISKLTISELLSYKKDGIAVGKMARDILVNNYLVAKIELIENHHFLLGEHLKNLLIIDLIYGRILDEVRPDRVVTNDSFYGMWTLLEVQCKRRSIPFYSHWPATRNRVTFGYNDAAMNMNFSQSWKNFSKQELTEDDVKKINQWLDGDRKLIIDSTKLAGHEACSNVLINLDANKPTIILAANVIWDLAALNKETIFDGMIEWIIETIDWFRNNSNYQLIIKPHPVEASPGIPKTNETVDRALRLSQVEMPSNVFLLKANEDITINALVGRCNVKGFAVYTTTVGFEFAAKGYSVVTAGLAPYRNYGFTIDPRSKVEYFSELESILLSNSLENNSISQMLAKKFIKFYQFHHYSDFKLFDGYPVTLNKKYLDELMKNGTAFDYVVGCIMDGVPVNDEHSWIPAS